MLQYNAALTKCMVQLVSPPSVLDLLDTQLREGVWVISQVEGVEWSTWVQVIQALHSWALTVCTVGLSQAQQQDLATKQSLHQNCLVLSANDQLSCLY